MLLIERNKRKFLDIRQSKPLLVGQRMELGNHQNQLFREQGFDFKILFCDRQGHDRQIYITIFAKPHDILRGIFLDLNLDSRMPSTNSLQIRRHEVGAIVGSQNHQGVHFVAFWWAGIDPGCTNVGGRYRRI